tara:strand:- start:45 stop:311 length:267 start_codon:yes stop_codon:yes gene_type:complete
MTDNEMNTLAKLVASMVINKLEAKQKEWDTELVQDLKEITDNSEEKLLSELAQAMTALDYNLKLENYRRCLELQEEIKDIENKLKNFK